MQESPQAPTGDGRTLVGQSVFLYAAIYVFAFFKFVAGFLVAKFLGPSLYGLRTVFGLVVEYEYYSHLGSFDAMQREVPFHRGGDRPEEADRVRGNVFGFNLAYAVTVGLIMMAVAVYLRAAGFEQIYVDFAVFLGVYVITAKVRVYFSTQMVADKQADLLARVRMFFGFVNAAASVTLVYFFSLRGLFIGLVLADLLTIAFVSTRIGRFPRPQLSPRVIGGLLRIGLPIMLIALTTLLLVSLDRIIIAAMLSRESLGFFAVGTVVSGMIYTSIADVTRIMFFPRLMEKLGRTRDAEQIRGALVGPTVIVAYLTPVLIALLFLTIHLPLTYLLPDYLPSIGVTRILVLGAFFITVLVPSLLVGVALDRQVSILGLTVLATLLNGTCNYVFIRLGWGIEGVALGTCVSFFFYSVLVIGFALSMFRTAASGHARMLGLVFAPFLYSAGLLFAIGRLPLPDTTTVWGDLSVTTLRFAIFCLLYGPVFLLVGRHEAFRRLMQQLSLRRLRGSCSGT